MDLTKTATKDQAILPLFISAETNLLRLPFFSLNTKGLSTLDGLSASGEDHDRVTGAIYRFSVRLTRNTATHYPGPLSRAIHLAFLKTLTETNYTNPVTWGWRELARTLGVTMSGSVQRNMKAAILATQGVLIHSDNAIYLRKEDRPISTKETALNLYSKVTFQGSRGVNGEVSDQNTVHLADWYIDNLRERYSAPLDYAFWQVLDAKSGIASRFYEYLIRAFYPGQDVYKVKYRSLAPFIPVRLMLYQSQIQEQLDGPLEILAHHKVIRKFSWTKNTDGEVILSVHRGSVLGDKSDGPKTAPNVETTIEISEVRKVRPPEWVLAAEFQRLWHKDENPNPTKKDQEHARAMIEQHGESVAKQILPSILERLRREWPDARSFAAVLKFAPDVAKQLAGAQRKKQRLAEEAAARAEHDREVAEEKKTERSLYDQWMPVWEELSQEKKAEVERKVLQETPFASNIPSFKLQLCLRVLSMG